MVCTLSVVPTANAWAINPVNSETIYAGTDIGVFKSTDGGANWTLVNLGLGSIRTNAVAVPAGTSSTVYTGTDSGVFRSNDAGATWIGKSSGLPADRAVRQILIDPTTPATLYIALRAGTIYKSVDSADSWALANQGRLTDADPTIAIDPANTSVLYAGTRTSPLSVSTYRYDKSTNGADSWSFISYSGSGVPTGALGSLVVAPFSSNILYSVENGVVRKSTDGGANWINANTGLPTSVSRLVADPATPGVLYSHSSSSVFKTTDGAVTWTEVQHGNPGLDFIVLDPTNSARIYALGLRAVKSLDAGNTWIPMIPFSGVNAAAIDPQHPEVFYIATDEGVYKSTDSGENFLPTTPVVPTLTGISPNFATRGARPSIVSLTGSGFVQPLTIEAGSEISATLSSFEGSARLRVNVTLAPNAVSGPHFFTVRTAGGTTNPVTFNVRSSQTSDFNNDGTPDLLVYSPSTGQTSEWLINGSAVSIKTPILSTSSWRATAPTDFDGDGHSDLLWFNSSRGETVMWLMNGSTLLTWAPLLTHDQWRVLKTGDFNGDGKGDLVWYNPLTGETALWLMNGTNLMAWASINSTNTVRKMQVSNVTDFNNDGKDDLLWYNSDSGETSIWLMDGVTVLSRQSLLTAEQWRVIFTPDLNGDTKPDLLWRHTQSGEVVAWLMDGTTVQSWASLSTAFSRQVTAIGDFNGDGKDDLLWYDQALRQTSNWLMNGTKVSSQNLLLTDPYWHVVVAADFNADLRTDLIWQYGSSGETAIWLMDGAGPSSYASLSGSVPGQIFIIQ